MARDLARDLFLVLEGPYRALYSYLQRWGLVNHFRLLRRAYVIFKRRTRIFRLVFRIYSTFSARARDVSTVRFTICSINVGCIQICRSTARSFRPTNIFTRKTTFSTTSIATSVRFNTKFYRQRMQQARTGLHVNARRLFNRR